MDVINILSSSPLTDAALITVKITGKVYKNTVPFYRSGIHGY